MYFKKNHWITVICLLLSFQLYSQAKIEVRKLTDADFVYMESQTEAYYQVYEPTFKARPIMKSEKEAKNRYPEELMISLISENTAAWVDYNTLKGNRDKSIKYFRQKITWKPDETYYELISKFEFSVGGEQYAYIKFRFHDRSIKNPPAGIYFLKKKGSRWFYTQDTYSNELQFAFLIFQPDILQKILKKEKSGNSTLDNFIDRVSNKGVVDLEKLGQETMKLYETTKSGKSGVDYDYFFELLNY